MILKLSRDFTKQVIDLKPSQRKRLQAALLLFQRQPYHPSLYNHPLAGQWVGYRSIAFGGNWRAHYKVVNENTAYFVACGTHSQLYK